jgi:hypothetical protein
MVAQKSLFGDPRTFSATQQAFLATQKAKGQKALWEQKIGDPKSLFATQISGQAKPFWGAQQGNRVILWENLGAGEKEECLKVLQKEANWAIWCKANPKDKGEQALREHSL